MLMNEQQAIAAAEDFLQRRGIEFVSSSATVQSLSSSPNRVVVIFFVPDALNPNAVVDPPDVRVILDKHTGSAEIELQM